MKNILNKVNIKKFICLSLCLIMIGGCLESIKTVNENTVTSEAKSKIKVKAPRVVGRNVDLRVGKSATIKLSAYDTAKKNCWIEFKGTDKEELGYWTITKVSSSNSSIATGKAIKSYKAKKFQECSEIENSLYGKKNYLKITANNQNKGGKCTLTVTYTAHVGRKKYNVNKKIYVNVRAYGNRLQIKKVHDKNQYSIGEQIKLEVTGVETDSEKFNWTISPRDAAKVVNGNGTSFVEVEPLKNKPFTVFAKSNKNRRKTDSINITNIKSIAYEYLEYGIDKGTTVTPELWNESNLEVVYSSSNPSVASINNRGSVTAKRNGTTVITATAEDGTTATLNVTVAKYTVDGAKLRADKYATYDSIYARRDSLVYTQIMQNYINKLYEKENPPRMTSESRVTGLIAKRSKYSSLIQFNRVPGATKYKIYAKKNGGSYYKLGEVLESEYSYLQSNIRQFVYSNKEYANSNVRYDTSVYPPYIWSLPKAQRRKYMITWGSYKEGTSKAYSRKKNYTFKVVAESGNTKVSATVYSRKWKKTKYFAEYNYMSGSNALLKALAKRRKVPYRPFIWDISYESACKENTIRNINAGGHSIEWGNGMIVKEQSDTSGNVKKPLQDWDCDCYEDFGDSYGSKVDPIIYYGHRGHGKYIESQLKNAETTIGMWICSFTNGNEQTINSGTIRYKGNETTYYGSFLYPDGTPHYN